MQKFYVEQGFRATGDATLKINTGEYNPLLGRSYAEIAAEGRSQHKTQEQGGIEPKGDRFSGLNLIESVAPKSEKEKNIFDGIDVSLAGQLKSDELPKNIPEQPLRDIQTAAERALREYEPENPQKIVPILFEGLAVIRKFSSVYYCVDSRSTNSGKSGCDLTYSPKEYAALLRSGEFIHQKGTEFNKLIALALGVRIDALADRETVAPNDILSIAVSVYVPDSSRTKIKSFNRFQSENREVEKTEPPKNAASNASAAAYFNVRVPGYVKEYTQPFWLREKRRGDFFLSDYQYFQPIPFEPSSFNANIVLTFDDQEFYLQVPVEYRYADPIRGEIRREINIVPRISLNPEQNLLVVSQTRRTQTKKIILNVSDNSSAAADGTARLLVPEKWRVEPEQMNFDLAKKGAKTSLEFNVTIPADVKTDVYQIIARVDSNDEVFYQTMHTIAYPHIQTHRYYTDAITKIDVLDLKIAPVKVGYIMGSGDEVPEAIRQMGLAVDLLGEKDLSGGDLAKYDVIVAGIRAYQVREDLIANNQKVLDYVKKGGTLIVQYQRPDYAANNLTPFPADMNDTQKTTAGTTARVVDENAKVTILDANSPVFNFPNKITDNDFANWVQERNLYNFVTFDKNYTPLLEAHDAGELENKGGMVYAKVGKGNYVYTSYSFFRQFPAGVPGAYRLFANLLSLPKATK